MEAGTNTRRALRADTGHNGEGEREGNGTIGGLHGLNDNVSPGGGGGGGGGQKLCHL